MSANNGQVKPNASDLHKKVYELLCSQYEHFKIEQEHPIKVQTEYGTYKTLYIDIYIPQLMLAVECHGEQHFRPVKHFGGLEAFRQQKVNDALKEKWCKNNLVSLVIVRFDDKLTPAFLKKKIKATLKGR